MSAALTAGLGRLSRARLPCEWLLGEEADDVASLTVQLVRGTLPRDL